MNIKIVWYACQCDNYLSKKVERYERDSRQLWTAPTWIIWINSISKTNGLVHNKTIDEKKNKFGRHETMTTTKLQAHDLGAHKACGVVYHIYMWVLNLPPNLGMWCYSKTKEQSLKISPKGQNLSYRNTTKQNNTGRTWQGIYTPLKTKTKQPTQYRSESTRS